jgi:hypothetical protein
VRNLHTLQILVPARFRFATVARSGMPALPGGISNAINALFTTRGRDGRLKDESFRKDQSMKKKTFDAVAFMRECREELSRAYAGLSAEQIHERIQESLKNNPLWKKPGRGKGTGKGT